MAAWILVPCLEALRGEFNQLNPGRDKSSDGSIGDSAHADRESDHNPDETGATNDEDSDSRNEVHAIDVDASGPWPNGMSMHAATRLIADRHRSGKDDRLQGVIYDREICWEPAWQWKPYSGSNPHDKHAHFSAWYDTGARENDRSPFGLLEKWGDDMPTVDEIWNAEFVDPYDTSPTPRKLKARDWLRYVPSRGQVEFGINETREANEKLDQVVAALSGGMEGLAQSIADKLLAAMPPGSLTAEQITEAVKQAFREGTDAVPAA